MVGGNTARPIVGAAGGHPTPVCRRPNHLTECTAYSLARACALLLTALRRRREQLTPEPDVRHAFLIHYSSLLRCTNALIVANRVVGVFVILAMLLAFLVLLCSTDYPR